MAVHRHDVQPEALDALVKAADAMGLWFISDGIYHGLVHNGYDGRRRSPRPTGRSSSIPSQILLRDRLADRLDG